MHFIHQVCAITLAHHIRRRRINEPGLATIWVRYLRRARAPARSLYRARNLVERFFNKIEQCRRVATRQARCQLSGVRQTRINPHLAAPNEATPQGPGSSQAVTAWVPNLSKCLEFSSSVVCTGCTAANIISFVSGNALRNALLVLPQHKSPYVQVAHNWFGFSDRSRRHCGLFRLAAIWRRTRRPSCRAEAGGPCRSRRAGQDRAGRESRFSGLFDRPRHGTGIQHGAGSHPGRRPDQPDRVQGRAIRQGRRYAGRDRSAAVPGGARPGHGQEGAGPGQSRQRQSRPAALHQARRVCHAPADRHAAFHGRAIDRTDCGRRCSHLQCANPA